MARNVDWLFYFILGHLGVLLPADRGADDALRDPLPAARGSRRAEASPSHNTALEITWTVIPLILVIVIFFFGFKGYLDMATPPANAYEILVDGQKWNWSFTYPNGYVDANLHVPVDRPVRLVMTSADVIHSLYVPAFRIKTDVVPGPLHQGLVRGHRARRVRPVLRRVLRHQPLGHAGQGGGAPGRASSRPGSKRPRTSSRRMTPVEAGQKLFQVRGCKQCHSVDGTAEDRAHVARRLRPHRGAGRRRQRSLVDENYIRESILEPQAKVVAGFEPVMPTYQGRLKDAEITAIIEYLKSLSGS